MFYVMYKGTEPPRRDPTLIETIIHHQDHTLTHPRPPPPPPPPTPPLLFNEGNCNGTLPLEKPQLINCFLDGASHGIGFSTTKKQWSGNEESYGICH